jgi:penicillin-insensitive murein DD-endopeptidase
MFIRLVILMILLGNALSLWAADSTCYGTSKQGKLDNAVALPPQGENYVAYHAEPVQAGRTYVHSTVARIIVDAYAELAKAMPDRQFMYGETGLQRGGPFPPHKTHQNGTSVDFFVPVFNKTRQSVLLPISAGNRYGYDIEFDRHGRFGDVQIDFDALGVHLLALQTVASRHNSRVHRVILDPALHELLYKSNAGMTVKNSIPLQKQISWVRHDEHYHVDFELTCRKLTAPR